MIYRVSTQMHIFGQSVPCPIAKKEKEREKKSKTKHSHKIVFRVVLSVVGFLGPIKAVCLSNKRWNQHRTG